MISIQSGLSILRRTFFKNRNPKNRIKKVNNKYYKVKFLDQIPNSTLYHHAGIIHNNKFIVISGSKLRGSYVNNILTYDIKKNKWSISKSKFRFIRSHTVHLVYHNNSYYLIIIGGLDRSYGKPNSKVYKMNIKNFKYKEINMKGHSILPRYSHKGVKLPSQKIIIFGGDLDVIDKNLYICDWKEKKWTEINVDENSKKPKPRFGHCFTLLPSFRKKNKDDNDCKLLLFYGMGPNQTCLNDVWVYDIKNKKWQEKNVINKISPRYGCSFNTKKQFIYIFGGINNKYESFNDLYEFDTTIFAFKKIELQTYIEPSFSSIMFFHNNNIIIHGGGSEQLCRGYNVVNKLTKITNIKKRKRVNFFLGKLEFLPSCYQDIVIYCDEF